MPNKPKTNQPQTPDEVQGRDTFKTPNYAVDLLVPYIPKYINHIWECCAYGRKITNRLEQYKYEVYSSDIRSDKTAFVYPLNFLTDRFPEENIDFPPRAIITNPPFSLKYKMIDRAIEYGIPFAFLIPFDMCQKMVRLFDKYNCQGLVPSRRIDFIPPSGRGSGSQFHSFWLTYKFNLPKQLTFVDLTNDQKDNI
jgi:hypothetical protein